MKSYDLVFIGAGPLTDTVIDGLQKKPKKIAVIAFPGNPETFFDRQMAAITGKNGTHRKMSSAQQRGDTPKGQRGVHPIDHFSGPCHFINPTTLALSDQKIASKQYVVLSGAVPHIPPLQGLSETGFLLPENALEKPPSS